MKFLLDENVDYRLVSYLTSQGHHVTSIAQEHPASLADHDVLAIARSEKRILITNDKDFGELIFRHHLPHAGVILLRLRDETLANVQTRLGHVLHTYRHHLHHFLVLTQHKIRIRKTPSTIVA